MSFRGGRSLNRHGAVTVTIRAMTAKCPENQPALDALMEIRIQAEQNPNSNYVFTIKKAMKSLQECKNPITTQKEATQLKGIGPRIAKIIIPNAKEDEAHPPPPPPPTATATQRKTKQTKLAGSSSTIAKAEQAGPTAKQKAYDKAKAHGESLVLPRAPWKVILIVDGRERDSKLVVSKCKQSGIPCEERHLPIGDMAWIAQCEPKHGTKLEVMCGTIIERKETNDLASSLFGTRYLEQRLRLQHCGVPQVLFLVEGSLKSAANCPAETLHMAMVETRVQLGFQIVQTKHMQDTVQLLKRLHRRVVQRTFPDAFAELPTFASPTEATRKRRRDRRASSLLELVFDTPPVPSFQTERFVTYQELKAKVERDREAGTRTVGAVYMAMLKQVATLSHKKCQAIATRHPTLNGLLEVYATNEKTNAEQLVKDLPCDRQKVGPKSSTELFVACCTQRDGSIPKPTNPYQTSTSLLKIDSASGDVSTRPAVASRPPLVSDKSRPAAPKGDIGANAKIRPAGVASLAVATKVPVGSTKPPNADECVDLTFDTPQKATRTFKSYAEEEPWSDTDDEILASAIKESLKDAHQTPPNVASRPNHSPSSASTASGIFPSPDFVSPASVGPQSTNQADVVAQYPSFVAAASSTPLATNARPPLPSSASSGSTFATSPKPLSPARTVSLETPAPRLSSHSATIGHDTSRLAKASSSIKSKQSRQSSTDSGSPLFTSPSSFALASSQSSCGSVTKINSACIEILSSDDDDEVNSLRCVSNDSPNNSPLDVENGLRSRLAKRFKQGEAIEID